MDGIISIKDPETGKVEGTVKVSFKRDFPDEVIKLCLDYLSKGLEEWQDRVIELCLGN